MNTRDLPIVILGVGLLYIAHLLQNNRLRLVDGFQNAPPPVASPPVARPPVVPPPVAGPPELGSMSPTDLTDIAQKVMSICEGPQNIDSIKSKINILIVRSPSPPPPPPAAMPPPMPAAMPAPMPRPTEGFQSSQNPYNSPSPSVAQAYEFRLGRKTLIDSTLDFMSSINV